MIIKIIAYAVLVFAAIWTAYGIWTGFWELYAIFTSGARHGDNDPSGNDNVKRKFYDYM